MCHYEDFPYREQKNKIGSTIVPGTPFVPTYTYPPYVPFATTTYNQTPEETSPESLDMDDCWDMDDYRAIWDSTTTGALIVFLIGLLFPVIWCFGIFYTGPRSTLTTRTFGYAAINALIIYAISTQRSTPCGTQ
mmetsp:Transcript_23622/g.33056  ORF Transcript_23622/g.33056 Transcript_23622/m.33056 type:complete len:134 (-) Transcript_23622:115-516(-)